MDMNSPFNFLNVQKVLNNGGGGNGRGFFQRQSKKDHEESPPEQTSPSEEHNFNILSSNMDSILEQLTNAPLEPLSIPEERKRSTGDGEDVSLRF